MDALRVQIISRDFNRMLEELAAIDASVEFSAAVDSVTVRVTQGSMNRTRAAREENIRRNHARAQYTTLEGKVYKLSNYFRNDALWAKIQNRRAARLQQKLAARGLAKQSWVHMGNKVLASSRHTAIPSVRAPSWVIAANSFGQQYPQDVDTFTTGSGTEYSRTIINRSPLIGGGRMEQALHYTMIAETRYFERLMSARFYLSHASRVAKYPGVFTRPTGFTAAIPAGL